MVKGFWENLSKPIIGLSPMDGVTDAAFRYITAKYGNPHVQFTEFVSAEGIAAGAIRLMDDFLYDGIERPVVAQIFGSSPDAFYKSAIVVSALGFDGLDINMGCPARSVAEHGGGAALIRTPKLAQELIRQAKKGVRAWSKGASLEKAGISSDMVTVIAKMREAKGLKGRMRREIPVSVKTRVGYDKVEIEDWVKYLLETEPVAISIHGRTLKQLYRGEADWEAVARAADLIHQTQTLVIGNGDVSSAEDVHRRVGKYNVDGVLIGRASFGNPWVFSGGSANEEEKLRIAVEHAQYFEKVLPQKNFLHMRKHLAWYASGFEGAKKLRVMLMRSSVASSKEIERTILDWQNEQSSVKKVRFINSFAKLHNAGY